MFTKDQVEKMPRTELRAACKTANIKYGKLSQMQIRDALVAFKPVKAESKKETTQTRKRVGSKLDKCVEIYINNKEAARSKLIELFVKAGCTPKGANTYVSLAKARAKKTK